MLHTRIQNRHHKIPYHRNQHNIPNLTQQRLTIFHFWLKQQSFLVGEHLNQFVLETWDEVLDEAKNILDGLFSEEGDDEEHLDVDFY